MQVERIPRTILLALGLVASVIGCKHRQPPPCLNAVPPEYIPPADREGRPPDAPPCLNAVPPEYIPPDDVGPDDDGGGDGRAEVETTSSADVLERIADALPPDVLARLSK